MTDSTKPTNLRKVPIRTSHTMSKGAERRRGTVFCAERACTLGIDECADCKRRVALRLDPYDRGSHVLCTGEEAARPASASPSAPQRGEMLPVSAIMTAQVVCVRSDLPVSELILLLVERGVSSVPVVDEHGRPVGIASGAELLGEWYDAIEDERELTLGIAAHAHRSDHVGLTVGEMMTPVRASVREDAPVAEAVQKMAGHGLHRLPVTGTDGTVVGIVSSLDLVRWMAAQLRNP